jgi:hypoxanthine phosphoribosyltransferase
MYYSVENFKEDADSLVKQIINSGEFYDYIVGIVRGGTIPAVYLSHRLGIPMRTVSWSTFHGDQMRESALDIAEDIADGKKILLVDDILDSGRTMRELLEDWGCDRSKVAMAVLVHNVRQETTPNFFGRTIDRETNTDWVDFWWEADNGATN